jgi:hypothetical protein
MTKLVSVVVPTLNAGSSTMFDLGQIGICIEQMADNATGA